MSLDCIICTKPYDNGEHALFSTKCGHVMGKSCLEKWASKKDNQSRFNCPVCREFLHISDCHQIFNLPIELLKVKTDDSKDKYLNEDDILEGCFSGKLKKGRTFFMETKYTELKGNKIIHFSDTHNGYILVAGDVIYDCGDWRYEWGGDNRRSFVQIFNGTSIFYSEDFRSVPLTAVEFNKFREDVVEFCVGFENGYLMNRVLSLIENDLGIPNKSVSINGGRKIHSICFLEKKKVVYSVGECNIFSISTDTFCATKSWLRNKNVRSKGITNLSVINNCVLLGVMYGKIYVFEKDKIPYVLYCDEFQWVKSYTYDSITNKLLIFKFVPYCLWDYFETDFNEVRDKMILSREVRSISRVSKYDNEGCRREEYTTYHVQDFQNTTYCLPGNFNSTLISMKYCEKYFTHSFLPDEGNNMLQLHSVNDTFNVVGKKTIENLDQCIGIFALKKPYMPFRCGICTEAYTTIGTEHALCSTKCGHLFGKRCLEKWKNENNDNGKFNCPLCNQSGRDYYSIYNVSKELLKTTSDDGENKCLSEDDVMRRYVLGTLKEKHFFIEQGNKGRQELGNIFIKFIDAYNGFILIVGSPSIAGSRTISFLKIYDGDNIFYNKQFKSGLVTALATNKCCEDNLEFCVGFKNGIILNTVFSLSKGVHGTPHETILFNDNEEINSICYLGHNNIVYSAGDCGVYNIHVDCIHLKKSWLRNAAVKLKTITNLKVVNDSTLFGLMDNKIYVFGKNETPYEIYSEEDLLITSFEYDSVSKIMLIIASKLYDKDRLSRTLKPVLLGIKENHAYETGGCTRRTYTKCSIEKFEKDYYRFPPFSCSLPIFTRRCSEIFTYTFIPDFKNNTLGAYAVNNGFTELANGEKIDCLGSCKRIVALDKPQFFTSKMLKIPIVVVFRNDFAIYNFYTSI
uniref:RING-type domain-containing protein n=1 Tax=Strongyloides papillosus TaxID=174720 RepID=A0A0N5BUJ8_STREA